MRYLPSFEVYQYYFKEKYANSRVMLISFYVAKQRDLKKEWVNKRYLVGEKFKGCGEIYYKYIDVLEYLQYEKETENTINYAKQLIVDIEALFEFEKVSRYRSKLIRNLGVSYQEFVDFEISYNYAVKFIEAVERVISQMSSEGRKDLMKILQKVTHD